jgi:hypothetical protein
MLSEDEYSPDEDMSDAKDTPKSTQKTKKRKKNSAGTPSSRKKAVSEARERKILTCPIFSKEFPPGTWNSELNEHIDKCQPGSPVKKELDSKAEADVKTEFKDYKDDFKTELEDCKPEKKDFKTDIEDCDIKSEASTDDLFERNKENIDMKEEDTEAHSIKPKEESINVENPTILTNNETHLSDFDESKPASSPKRTSMSTQGTVCEEA